MGHARIQEHLGQPVINGLINVTWNLFALGIAPMGLFMGMPFPIGMKVAAMRRDAPTAFFWGVNGATSVAGSVLTTAVALGWGLSISFWVGMMSYVVAAAGLAIVIKRGRV